MLPFIPRKVARSLPKKAEQPVATTSTTSPGANSLSRQHPVQPADVEEPISDTLPSQDATTLKGKGKEKDTAVSSEDCVTLLLLSVSDYALWSDSDLRWTMESAEEGCTSTLRYLTVFGLMTCKIFHFCAF